MHLGFHVGLAEASSSPVNLATGAQMLTGWSAWWADAGSGQAHEVRGCVGL